MLALWNMVSLNVLDVPDTFGGNDFTPWDGGFRGLHAQIEAAQNQVLTSAHEHGVDNVVQLTL